MRRCLLVLVAAFVVAVAAAPAGAAPITSVFAGQTMSGNPIPCTAQADGVRVCHGTDNGGGANDLRLKAFDGSPLEVWVILPAAPKSGTDGNYPFVVQSHGWGVPPTGPNDTQFYGPTADTWAKNGYAVMQLAARGWGDSCGTPASRASAPAACQSGYIRLDDERYEVRDIQYESSLLVDDGVVDPARIGATGESYGGGVSLELATLKDRIMNADGTLHPWRTPKGTPMHLAAAAPVIPWSDLVYSLMPNGRTLDYRITGPTADLRPVGVEKQSFVSALFALGAAEGDYSATDQQADLPAWNARLSLGEPYDGDPLVQTITEQIARFHSAYYLLDGAYGTAKEPPAPLLIANGFTDDLFPVDEAVRYYNLERALYPSDPIALLAGDFGHMRAQNKPGDKALVSSRIQAMFDHYLKGTAPQSQLGATATIETCPSTATSGGPFSAASWAALHPGEVDFSSPASQTILSTAGNPAISRSIDPIAGDGACASPPATDQGPGVATYRLPAPSGHGYTLLGSPTVIATLNVTGEFPEIAARLWDVNPSTNTETLVARGIYRIDPSKPNGRQIFQLHPGAWLFAEGHIPKLELLGQDAPYGRASNGQFSIAVSGLQLRLPVHDVPGAPGTSPAVTQPLRHP
jgi:acetyl xylan esterase AXE1